MITTVIAMKALTLIVLVIVPLILILIDIYEIKRDEKVSAAFKNQSQEQTGFDSARMISATVIGG